MATANVSAVIPSRDGADLLGRCLPALLEADPGLQEIIVVDDGSEDSTADLLRRHFPTVVRLRMPRDSGFGRLCNAGVRACRNRLVLLINNDMVPQPGFLAPLLEWMARADVFAVGPQYRMRRGPDGAYVCSSCGDIHRESDSVQHSTSTRLDAPAGGGLFDREKFLQLGGFDPLFLPFYWEDMDLGLQAWRHGWRIVHEPRSVMYHEQGATIRRVHSRVRSEVVFARNRFLFAWKNIRDADLLVRHLWGLPVRLAADVFSRGGLVGARGLAGALARLPRAMSRRAAKSAGIGISDKELLRQALGSERAAVSLIG